MKNKSLQGAMVTLDLHDHLNQLPILSALGGAQPSQSYYHRGARACLPIASTIKPLIYSYAIHRGSRWSDLLSDAPVSHFSEEREQLWRPKRHRRTRGRGVRMVDALAYSLNAPILHLTRRLGINSTREWLSEFGLSDQPHDLTLALGSACATPVTLSLAYAQVAQERRRTVQEKWFNIPRTLSERLYREGLSPLDLWLTPSAMREAMVTALKVHREDVLAEGRRRLKSTLKSTSEALSAVVKRGTAKAAHRLKFEVRGKTGTHERSDTWFVGYRPQRLTTVWVGSDPRSTLLGHQESGAKSALPIWLDFMRESDQGLQAKFVSTSPLPHQQPSARQSVPDESDLEATF